MMAPDAHNGAKCPEAGAVWDSNPGPPTEPHKSRGSAGVCQACTKTLTISQECTNTFQAFQAFQSLSDQHTTLIYELLLTLLDFDI